MKEWIEDIAMLIMITLMIGTCGFYHMRQADRAVDRYERNLEPGRYIEVQSWTK